ncbi:MAG: silent information regulator protein Sir2 [Phycisphaerae bacterium]|nr:silent information regulator protein Sir2 [Phycisphaerae bacterium]NIP52069.1 silent information regulator protein Sir2 [Phycisphaerae bacterium]NIS50034.1 silent information regulator protein Sir2 [Phycisphaerae bacterium]NIU10289.1 silent information regulator protein Sir2 [Phycisphaerae bacterium]NIU55300.1 silent information regulator protein Sir2 [Phycisphaerae bacterium]
MRCRLFTWIVGFSLVLILCAAASGVEKLDRGLVALEHEDGSVFLSWRLLADDPPDMAFTVLRVPDGLSVPSQWANLTKGKPYTQTSFVDKERKKKKLIAGYALYRFSKNRDLKESEKLDFVGIFLKPYITIPLKGDYDFQKVGIGDLDGDGNYEYVIKQPNFNTDPYQRPGYWKRSPTTYKLEAYRLDGTMMWRYDMGWAIEAGIWYSPWIVYDVDGDGKAEVYCKAGEGDPREEAGHVKTGPEYLVKIDGETGKVIAKTDWLSREGFSQYNYYCRNFLTVAYLDGKKPSLIMQRGTYNLIKMQALDKDFKRIWYWESLQEKEKYRSQSAHGLITADVDGDGRDELVIGSAVLDDNGKGLWTTGMGHPDICYVADIDPDNPGLEIFYGIEPRRKTDAICVVDAKTGRKLWTHKEPTRHVHGQGMVGDILADSPGMEVFAGERDLKKRWLYSAKGKLIEFHETGSLSPRAVWWDADPQKEVVVSGAVRDWGKDPIQPIQGRVIAVVDCLGDYREEVITTLKGELRIYTTTIPASDRRTCLMQDHQYRLGVVAQTMGYYYPAQLGK